MGGGFLFGIDDFWLNSVVKDQKKEADDGGPTVEELPPVAQSGIFF